MTKRELKILNEMKDEAMQNYFNLLGTEDEEIRNSPVFDHKLSNFYTKVMTLLELLHMLEKGA